MRKKTVEETVDYEEVINNKIQNFKSQLHEIKKNLAEYKAEIDDANLSKLKKIEEYLKGIDIKKYRNEIQELEKQIPEQIKRQYQKLSESEIISAYASKIEELKTLIHEVENDKCWLEGGMGEKIEDREKKAREEKALDEIRRKEIDKKNAENTANAIADFWTLVNNPDNSRLGMIITTTYGTGEIVMPDRHSKRINTLLEFELSKRYGKPIPSSYLEYREIIPAERGSIDTSSSFIDESNEEISLRDKNAIYIRKEEIEKLKEKAQEHPEQYSKPGTINLYDNVRKTGFKIEITQGELIALGLEPISMGWKEIEKAKVDSTDIARASKEKGVKKSLIDQIASIFSRKRVDREK